MGSVSRREVWFCCSCGDGPMSMVISDVCHNTRPNANCLLICAHRRCDDCPVEVIEALAKRSSRGKRRHLNPLLVHADAALLPDQCANFNLDPTTTPANSGVHATFWDLADPLPELPSGTTEPHPHASWSAEPHIRPTPSIQAYPLHDFQLPITQGLNLHSPLPTDIPDHTSQFDTTLPLEHQSQLLDPPFAYSPHVTNTLDDLEAVWLADSQLLQLPYPIPAPFQQDNWTSELGSSQIGLPPAIQVITGQPQTSHHNVSRRKLACPFFKKDFDRAWSGPRSCRNGHSEIKDVKLHLRRQHGDTPAGNTNPLGRLTESQFKMIGTYSSRGAGEPAHWYAIWNRIFPELRPPASPYISEDPATEVDEFRYFRMSQITGIALLPESNDSIGATPYPYGTPYYDFPFSPLPSPPELHVPIGTQSPGSAFPEPGLSCNIADALLPVNFGWHNYI